MNFFNYKLIKMLRFASRATKSFASVKPNPFEKNLQKLKVDGKEYKYFSLPSLGDARYGISFSSTFHRITPLFRQSSPRKRCQKL